MLMMLYDAETLKSSLLIEENINNGDVDDVVWALNKVDAAKEFIVRNRGGVLVHKVLEW